jgi:hypothetical protein
MAFAHHLRKQTNHAAFVDGRSSTAGSDQSCECYLFCFAASESDKLHFAYPGWRIFLPGKSG